MIEVFGYRGRVVEVRGDKALFEFTHPEDAEKQRMWIDAKDAGIKTDPSPSGLRYTGGGIVGCHTCGTDWGECEHEKR